MVHYQVWLIERLKKITQHETMRFLVVGGFGFIVNFSVLWLLHGLLRLPLLTSQIVAAETAIIGNFALHHWWTYKGYKEADLTARLLKFHSSAWTGSLITTLVLVGLVRYARVHYLAALAAGALVGMTWNYLMNRFVIWSK